MATTEFLNVTVQGRGGKIVTGRVAYDDVGQGAQTVVLLHGLMCSRSMWDHQREWLRRHWRVVSIDLPGHGESRFEADPRVFNEDVFADVVVEVLATLKVLRPVVVGFSMGGGVALNIAARHPACIGALVLADVGAGSDVTVTQRAAMVAGLRGALADGSPTALFEALLKSPAFLHYAARGERERAQLRAMMTAADPETLDSLLAGILGSRQPVQDRPLEQIALMTRILVGELDTACTEPSEVLARRMVTSELITLPAVGHMTPLEAPEEFSRAIGSFLHDIGWPA